VIKVLVVDDSALMRKLLGRILTDAGEFEVEFANSGADALARLEVFAANVITLDIHMPQMDGLTCLDRIMLEHPTPVVMVSSLTAADADATLEAFRLGAVDFVAKPEGAMSLYIDELTPELLGKVRAAAGAKLKATHRLKDRVRHRMGIVASSLPVKIPARARGEGLVLVGVSTGGPPALEALLGGLPGDFPWPVLIAQHMPASFTGPLARRLDHLSALTVSEVRQPTLLKPGCAYIGEGGADIVVSRRAGSLMALSASSDPAYPWHPSTDRLVRTAMEHVAPAQLIGVLMTGMGNDGALAMAALHEQGGRTIAEAEETAVVWGMPGELVQAGGADWILPLPGIAERVRKLTPVCR
jgi:two-component system chemotaxis response regulator CheB